VCYLGRETVERVLARRDLSAREQSLWHLIDASHERNEPARQALVLRAAEVLTPDEVYLASMVISLFNFYNAFVDLTGVDELTVQGYEASGARLSTVGYSPPPAPPAPPGEKG
jgi:hypothetical protein